MSVKITDLPSIPSVAADDVLIVNDTSTGVTSKATVSNLSRSSEVTFSLPTGLVATLSNGTTTSNFTGTALIILPNIKRYRLQIPNDTVISNNTSSDIEFTLAPSDANAGTEIASMVHSTYANTNFKFVGATDTFPTLGRHLYLRFYEGLIRVVGSIVSNTGAVQSGTASIAAGSTCTLNNGLLLTITITG